MFTITNLVKALIIATVIGITYGFYEASTGYQQQVGFTVDQMLDTGFNNDPKVGRIEAFIEASKTMEAKYFWPHHLMLWFSYCGIIFIGCLMLLAVVKTPNKKRNEMDGSDEPPIR